MNLGQIKHRRLEIATELAKLAEHDCKLRTQMIGVELAACSFNVELAELDLIESEVTEPTIRPQRAVNGR